VAALARRFGAGELTLIENALQEAGLRALERWHDGEVPRDPEGWLLRVAHNAVADALRRERRLVALGVEHEGSVDPPAPEIDDELRLVFLACHPVLPRAAQIALTLNVAYGLTASRIAPLFLSDPRAVAQRLVRAKQRLREEGVPFDLPEAAELPARLEAILDVIYQLFTLGHEAAEGDGFDDEICAESLRLSRLLTSAPRTATPAARALHALLCFQAARAPARRAEDGSLLLLQEQDRARWDGALLTEGFVALGQAAEGRSISRFHVEAGIAACHAAAPSFAETDWTEVLALYDTLRAIAPSPVVDVSRAFAVAMCRGAHAGLDELDAIPERDLLARYPYALATYAELHASLGHLDQARSYLDRALAHQPAPGQQSLLRRKRAALS
jgi:RNA polymerase sigma-70 factor (ECF subfamily)